MIIAKEIIMKCLALARYDANREDASSNASGSIVIQQESGLTRRPLS